MIAKLFRIEKLLDELKQVKAILKSPMLYYKFRDKTFSEIESAKLMQTDFLNPEIFGATRGQILSKKSKTRRNCSRESVTGEKKHRKAFSISKVSFI
jgi:hypothetical protein